MTKRLLTTIATLLLGSAVVWAAEVAKTLDWGFSIDNPVQFDASQIELSGEVLRLKPLDQTDSSKNSFSGAAFFNTYWNAQNQWVTVASPLTLPDGAVQKSATAWTDMTGNALLMHFDSSVIFQGTTKTFPDASGKNNVATCTGSTCPQLDANGKLGTALWFDGTNDELTSTASWGGTEWKELTLETWVRFDGISTALQAIAESNDISFIHFQASQTNSIDSIGCPVNFPANTGYNAIYVTKSGVNNTIQMPLLGLGTFGQWRHVAITVKSGNPGSVTMYSDGKEVCTRSAAFDNLTATTKLHFGRGWSGEANRRLKGALDELAIYKRALSADEIKSHYDQQSKSFAGYFDSRTLNVGSPTDWTSLSWMPVGPNGVQLPDNATEDTGYLAGGATMTGNVLLAHLNESTGTAFADASGQGNKGTCTGTGCPTLGGDGKFATAASFDGVDDQISIPSSASLNVTTAVTVEAWIYPKAMPNTTEGAGIISKGNDGNNDARYELLLLSNSDFVPNAQNAFFRLSNHTTTDPYKNTQYPFVYGGNMPLNAWSHVVGTYDGSVISLYVNGVQVASQPMTGGPIKVDNNPLMIGVRQLQSGDMGKSHFKGMIDEVAVYNRALTSGEVQSRYLRGAIQPKFQVRSCDKADCAGVNFVGPGNSDKTFYTPSALATSPQQAVTLSGIAKNPYFQYRAYFDSKSASLFPALKSVAIGPNHFPATGVTVTVPTGQDFALLESFSDVLGDNNKGEIRYQLSSNGSDWYFCYGNQWQKTTDPLLMVIPELGELQKTNSASKVNACAPSFASVAGAGKIFVKAFFHSPTATEVVELKRIKAGYYLTAPEAPPPPPPSTIALSDIPTLTITEGSKLSITLDVSKAGMTAPYQYMCQANCPEGMSIASSTGEVTWTPTYKQAGKYSDISFKVKDAAGKDATQNLSLIVQDGIVAPVIKNPGDKVVEPGQNVSFTVTATDGDEGTPTYSIASGKQEGMELNSSTGFFTWTPKTEQAGTYIITLRAVDSADPSIFSDQAIAIVVNKSASSAAPEAPQHQSLPQPTTPTTTGSQATTAQDQPATQEQPAAATIATGSGCSLIR